MGLNGKVAGGPARCLVDTGASGDHYLSAGFCERVGIAVQSRGAHRTCAMKGKGKNANGKRTGKERVLSFPVP